MMSMIGYKKLRFFKGILGKTLRLRKELRTDNVSNNKEIKRKKN